MSQRWWLVVERAQATLPLLAAAGLAGFTWWLVQSSPKDHGPARPQLSSSSPDYELSKARVARFDAQGRLEAIVDGQSMRHYGDTDQLLIDQLVLSARDKKGRGLHAVSNEGVADHRAEIVTLKGGARVVAMPIRADQGTGLHDAPVRFAGEGLKVDTRQHVVSSDQAVWLTQDHSQIQAQSIVYDGQTRIATLGGRVKGHYESAAPRTAAREQEAHR